MTRQRILEFVTYAGIGGTQQMLLEALRYASHANHAKYQYTVCVLLQRDVLNEELSHLNIENFCLNMQGYWDVSVWWKLYRFVKNRQFDLIRTYGLKADLIGRIVGKCAGIPVNITSVRSTDPWRKWYHVFLDRLTSRLTDLYLSNSEAGRMAIHGRERIPLAKIRTISNGIDLEKYTPYHAHIPEISARYREDFQISPTTPVLGIVANLGTMKGHATILEAFPLMRQAFPDLKCVFVGRDDLNGTLQRDVCERKLEQNIICTGIRRDIPELIAMLDVFLLPSLWEGFPMALLEAMAMKRPIVASSVGGIPEMIESGKTGLLIPPQNPEALARAVLFLLKHPEKAAEMGNAAYQRIQRDFYLQTQVARTEDIYEHLIRHKKQGTT
ncbi:putative glycosyl transferase, group 1 [Candidatus Vecturithrix granuli]|uniref:Putative glycosyl transferase, group 1 n=1 Tax=Vecturithrix granuli TaxID=1499967 RepID=A0A081BY58_VECG1|nr:putative glycosyl transferase, group 1 [Candidatus Vecturithrix granuli]